MPWEERALRIKWLKERMVYRESGLKRDCFKNIVFLRRKCFKEKVFKDTCFQELCFKEKVF